MNRDIVKDFSEHIILELELQYSMRRVAIAIHEQDYDSLLSLRDSAKYIGL